MPEFFTALNYFGACFDGYFRMNIKKKQINNVLSLFIKNIPT